MKKSISLVIAIVIAITSLNSCGSKSGKRQKEILKAEEKVVENTEITNEVKEEPQPYTFQPARIEITEPIENTKDLLGEGQIPGHSFGVTVFFIDSLGQEFEVSIYGDKYDDATLELEEEGGQSKLDRAKNVYKEIINTPPTELLVTISAGGNHLTLEKKSIVTEKRVGTAKAIVRTSPLPSLWQGHLN